MKSKWIPKKITVNDLMQKNYNYYLTEPVGKNFDPAFKPDLSPSEMLKFGVFGGKYMTDCAAEFPPECSRAPKLARVLHDRNSTIQVNASQPLRSGGKRAGYTRRTRAAGFSGTAAITWAAGFRGKTRGKSAGGAPSGAMRHK